MRKSFLIAGAVSAAMAVALGAFGAHGLQKIISDDKLIPSFQTGVQYHLYHSLAIILTGIIFNFFSNRKIFWAGFSFIIGIILFSGSLYLLTFLKHNGSNLSGVIGPITPIGGVMFIAGWILLAFGILHRKT